MNWENTKRENNYIKVELPDLKIGDVFLFAKEKKTAQGHIVVDIYRVTEKSPIIVEYMPEWAHVTNSSLYQYGRMKIKMKN